MDVVREALLSLGRALALEGYRFVPTTPETHRRVLARKALAEDLRDVFGWSAPFEPGLLGEAICSLLEAAGAIEEAGAGTFRSKVRFSSLGGRLFVHSAYPTRAPDAVFFGPDTYRFCAFVRREAPPARHVVDLGCGAGAGGLVAAEASGAGELQLLDVNPRALLAAEVSARLAGVEARTLLSDGLSGLVGAPELIVSNPPYMLDGAGRLYRDGGGRRGEALSLRIVRESIERLAPGGTLLLYTGAPVVRGRDTFREAVTPLLGDHEVSYEELDPDVFGEELEEEAYAEVERIAVVGLRVRKSSRRSRASQGPHRG